MAKDIRFRQLLHYWPLYTFILPSFLLVATFAYFPAISAFYHAFYRWNGNVVNYFIGWSHFEKALGSPLLWLIALCFIVFFMTMGHRKNKRGDLAIGLAGIFVPAIVLVGLAFKGVLLGGTATGWFTPITGLLFCAFLYTVLHEENDQKRYYIILGLTMTLASILSRFFSPVAAWTLSTLLVGVYLQTRARTVKHLHGWRIVQGFAALGMALWALGAYAEGDRLLWSGFGVISILVVANIVKLIPSIVTAVVIHRLKSDAANYWYRVFFVIPMIIPGIVYLLIWKLFFEATDKGVFNFILTKTGLMHVLIQLDQWLGWGGLFQAGQPPAWLSHPDLVVPAFIIWGFPWVGVVGVLIYLAGLQSIDNSVYEAADLDGIGALGKFLHIELPLIMTQVRINMIMLIIGTFQMYGFILILFGDSGGPNGRVMVPDLYMFRKAFTEAQAGYACCIGMILFFFILILSEINNRYVRVEK